MNQPPSAQHRPSALLRQLDLKHLIAFEAIYSTNNISRAGQALGYSQPKMSNLLARLRTVFHDPLFVRNARGVVPTARAEYVAEPIRRALAELDSITTDSPTFDPSQHRRYFRLHILDIFESSLLPSVIRKVQSYKGISFQILLTAKVPMVEGLESGEIDLALGLPPPGSEGLRWEELTGTDLIAIARKGHPEINGSVTKEQLLKYGTVSLDMTPGAMVNTHFLKMTNFVERRDVVRVTRPSAIVDIVAQTDLIGYANKLHVQTSPRCDELQLLAPTGAKSVQHMQMTWHSRNDNDPAIIWLREAFRKALKEVRETLAFQSITAKR